jgi:hypothetical protein
MHNSLVTKENAKDVSLSFTILTWNRWRLSHLAKLTSYKHTKLCIKEINIHPEREHLIDTSTDFVLMVYMVCYYCNIRAWSGIVVKPLRYSSEGPGIDSRWCHWRIFPWHPTIPCIRGRLSLLKRVPEYSWGYQLQVPMSRNLWKLNLPEPSGSHRPVMGMLYLF